MLKFVPDLANDDVKALMRRLFGYAKIGARFDEPKRNETRQINRQVAAG